MMQNEIILQELAAKEDELYSEVKDLNRQPSSKEISERLGEIFIDYKKVHKTYADMSSYDIEALKRGLFIQWYAINEPSYLTGISDLDANTEAKIITVLNNFIKEKKTDYELTWMLNYYARWDWIFKRIESFKGFDETVVNEKNDKLPRTIDKEKMQQRGQMGKYWNSLKI